MRGQRKRVLPSGGDDAAKKVAHGQRRDRRSLFISEILPIKGVKLAGPLPGDTQLLDHLCAAIPASSTDAAAARAFIAALTSAAMAQRWPANGFEPPK